MICPGRALAREIRSLIEYTGTDGCTNTEINRFLQMPEARKQITMSGMIIETSSIEHFAEFLKRESTKYQKVIEAAGIKSTL